MKKKLIELATGALAVLLLAGLATPAAAQDGGGDDETGENPGWPRWCGKVYEAGYPAFEPGGHTTEPRRSNATLLHAQLATRHSIYVAGEEWGSFVVSAALSPWHGDPYENRTSDGVTTRPFDRLRFSVHLVDDDATPLVQDFVDVNATGVEYGFRLEGLEPRYEPYEVVFFGASEFGDWNYTATAEVQYLPAIRAGGSATKIDRLTGSLLFHAEDEGEEWTPLLPYGYYGLYNGSNDTAVADEFVRDYTSDGTGLNAIVALAGFADTNPVYDSMDTRNLRYMFDLRGSYQNLTEVERRVNTIKHRKSLFAYWTADEPDGWQRPFEAPVAARDLIRALDPYHPVALTLNCQDYYFGPYSIGGDVLMADVYPIGINSTFSKWGTACNTTYGDCGCDNCAGVVQDVRDRWDDLAQYERWLGRWPPLPKFHNPQVFHGEDYWFRDPTAAEARVMNALAFNRGITGIFGWTWPGSRELFEVHTEMARVVTAEPVSTFLLGGMPQRIEVEDVLDVVDVAIWGRQGQGLVSVVNGGYLDIEGPFSVELPVPALAIIETLFGGRALAVLAKSLPVRIETRTELSSRLANIHVSVDDDVLGPLTFTYGSCSNLDVRNAHHEVGRYKTASTSRLVWIMPEDVQPTQSEGCISAWDIEGNLVGRSERQRLKLRKRGVEQRGIHSIPMNNKMGIDTLGPWFDGVKLLEGKNLSAIDVAEAKAKDIAIVGAGMAGLTTFLILHQSGLTNVRILEASQRLGGRVRTEYLSGGPFDYSYQEMGPMRFPHTIEFGNDTFNVTDHQMVFQLADEMNRLNNHDRNLSVDFIPWIQQNENGLHYFDGIKMDTGLPPTLGQVATDPSLAISFPLDESTRSTQAQFQSILANGTLMFEIATNMHRAHKDFLINGLDGKGGDVWSAYAYLANYLGASLNDTDIVTGGFGHNSFWFILFESMNFGATTWKTIDGGRIFSISISNQVHPEKNSDAENKQFNEEYQKLNLQWRSSYMDWTFQNATFDYAILAMPFPMVQKLRLPKLGATITNAINKVPFASGCKVALEYKTRFWEHFENPIYGGWSETDIPGVGWITYPSYCLNCTGPASLLASYVTEASWGDTWVSVSEEQHVQYVVDAMAEIHGQVAYDEYTGNYRRKCWREDEFAGGGWAQPTIGQHQLYIPEYFKTHKNMIFVGEQTSYTHSWVASALESGVRGAVQMLLELGLVDEAKAAVDKWMGRWLDV
ncbi:hypothetical protein DL770_005885 [Monosporascus sp. CRB-9-2]|nr:hypothetical protein DL770_005885 [Monosporascus sp. CRB-9-2]